jgi:hypothetical protein
MRDQHSQELTNGKRKVLALLRLNDMLNEMGSNLKALGIRVKALDAAVLRSVLLVEVEVESIEVTRGRLECNFSRLNGGQLFFLKKLV